MKKIIAIVTLILMSFTLASCKTSETVTPAKEFNAQDVKQVANVYLFWRDGCPHCEKAKKFFSSIEEQYSSCYKLVEYEVWKDQANAQKMNAVVSALKITEDIGVPFIVIGDQHFIGYSEQYNEQILKSITDSCVSEDYEDLVAPIVNKK